MKREAAAFILLIALFSGSLFNIRVMSNKIGELRQEVSMSYLYAQNGDMGMARAQLKAAADKWSALDCYTHIFIRHTEIDSATDAFFDMLSDISTGDMDALAGSYRKLDAHLMSLITAEQISIGSIL